MRTPIRPVLVSLTGSPPAGQQRTDVNLRGEPIFLEIHGFVLRSLVPDDVTPRVLEWLSDAEMMRGLNLGGLNFTIEQLRNFVARFDNRTHYFIGVFDQSNGLLVGFYTMDVGLAHKIGQITTGVGEPSYDGKRTLWATIDALLDHFYAEREVEKISARVLANNYRMLFLFKENSRFVLEGCLRQECLSPSGGRLDILVFSSFKNDGKKGVFSKT
ncbi:GNAT family N-acetyltransferase [Mesorhizobium xinjiangense]|uniref:GNAT family N-acetyltransferase n=1 Tax=Mesorhizobium xinjiangense TaxID=2678685 RepID=UPI0012EDF65A|nr:GNAT family N-acetyltransferase [Mesorhizobium xinjiangense]